MKQQDESTKIMALARGRDMKVSPKDTREVAGSIRGLSLESAKSFLGRVIELKQAVPFRRFHREVGHKKSGIGPGRYPKNAAKAVLEILKNAEANAKFKGLDGKTLKVSHISVSQGIHKRRGLARAFAKGPSRRGRRSNVEIRLISQPPVNKAEGREKHIKPQEQTVKAK